MILIALISNHLELEKSKTFKIGFPIYNIGLILTVVMLTVRGVMDVKGVTGNSAISGLAGTAHIIFAAGILLILHAFVFLSVNKKKESKNK